METTHLAGRVLGTAVIRSIGVSHDGAHQLVTDGLYLDLRTALRNPAEDPAMRYRTGPDPEAHEHVLSTLGARELIARTAVQLQALADEVPVGRLVRLTVVCQGGRHRSVAVANEVARLIWLAWDGEVPPGGAATFPRAGRSTSAGGQTAGPPPRLSISARSSERPSSRPLLSDQSSEPAGWSGWVPRRP
ncbi:RapZ C-terminal domain-containing protein [Streptomyces vinaceus]|uniref:RapZ C-terminal domain-containing protein n=1 Tax=Streptomyces vinaceus TaxID=1960 RepID=UPI00382383B9